MIIQTGGRIKLDISNGEFKFSAVNYTSTYSRHEADLWNKLIKEGKIQLNDKLNDNINKLKDAWNNYNDITNRVAIIKKKAASGPTLPHGVIPNMEKLKKEEKLKKLETEEELAKNDFNDASSAAWSDIESRGKEYGKWLNGESGRSYFNKSMNALITEIAKNNDHANFMHDKLLTIFQERHRVDNYRGEAISEGDREKHQGHVYFTNIFKKIFFNFCEKRYKIVYKSLEEQLKTAYESFRKKMSGRSKQKRDFIRHFNRFIKTETREKFTLESLDIFDNPNASTIRLKKDYVSEEDDELKIDEVFKRLAHEYCEGVIGMPEPHPPIFTAVNLIIHYYNEHLKPQTTSEEQTTSNESSQSRNLTKSNNSSQSQNLTKTRKKQLQNKVQEDAKKTRTHDEGKSNKVKEEGGRHIRAKSKKKLIIDNKKRKTTRKNIKPIK